MIPNDRSSQGQVPVVLYLQGGAALGAFSAGAINALAQNPKINIVGISATSINGLQGAFVTEAILKGGQASVPARVAELWYELAVYQRNGLPLWYHAAQSLHDQLRPILQGYAGMMAMATGWQRMAMLPLELAAASSRVTMSPQASLSAEAGKIINDAIQPWFEAYQRFATDTGEDALQRLTRNASNFSGGASQPTLKQSPILGFLDYMAAKGRGLDFDTIQQTNRLIVNATHVPLGANPWAATPQDAVAFRGRAVTADALAASGALADMMPAVMIDGQRLFDGGYSTNPIFVTPKEMGITGDAVQIMIRTRPEGGVAMPHNPTPAHNDEKRGFFNSLTDRQWQAYAQTQPGAKIVVEPAALEVGHRMITPELDFSADVVNRRMREGFEAATQAMTAIMDRQSPSTPVRARQVTGPRLAA